MSGRMPQPQRPDLGDCSTRLQVNGAVAANQQQLPLQLTNGREEGLPCDVTFYGPNLSEAVPDDFVQTLVDPNLYPVPPEEGWQRSMSSTIRRNVIYKIVYSLFPTSDTEQLADPMVPHLAVYANQLEEYIFEVASSREQYYLLIAKNIFDVLEKQAVRDHQTNGT